MKDIGTTLQTSNPSWDVVRRLVARLQADADLAYLICPGTETYDHLLRAVQQVWGVDEAKAREALRCHSGERARLVTLRERLGALDTLVAALPACDVCGEPATHETRQQYPFCREHAPGGCSEFPWAKALEAAL